MNCLNNTLIAESGLQKSGFKEKLSLLANEIISDKIRSLGLGISEYSFSNLYLFRKIHDYSLIQDDFLWLYGKSRDGREYIMPLDDICEMSGDYLEHMLKLYGTIFPIPEEKLVFLEDRFTVEYDSSDSDYIYASKKLAAYAGRQMHKKKNLLNQFLSLYTPSSAPLSKETLLHAIGILDEWVLAYENAGKSDESDYDETKEAILLADELSLSGTVYYADGEPAGFILGEALSDGSFALHFAKGLVKFKGIYQFMYNNFAKAVTDIYPLLNFEQDLGSPALRRAKESYRPDTMLKKYRVTLK